MMDYIELGDRIVTALNADADFADENIPIVPVMAQSAIQKAFVAYQRTNIAANRVKQTVIGLEVTFIISVIHPTIYSESLRLSGIVRNAMESLRLADDIKNCQLSNHTEMALESSGFAQQLEYVIEI